MESGETDWNNLSLSGKSERHSMIDDYQKQESSSFMDNQSEQMYDGSTLGGEDDYMSNLGLYDGYESYNDSGSGMSDDENQDGNLLSHTFQQPKTGSGRRQKNYRYLNGKDGMATCERCGAVGVKHAFYSKSKRFCSLSCSRSFATSQREGKPATRPINQPASKKGKPVVSHRKSMAKSPTLSLHKAHVSPGTEMKMFDWGPYLVNCVAQAAPVYCFKHVPMDDSWEQISVGMKVEVVNIDCDLPNPVYWIASVIRIAGYLALMRYEGFGNDASHDFWINLVSEDVHPVGWCATIGKPLVPPQSIQNKYTDWKDFLVKRLTGSRTLPGNFYAKFHECIGDHKLKVGMKIEVMDKMCVSAMRVAVIEEIVGGRLRLTYIDSKDEGDEFWCHMKSPLIHPVGWSQTVGHKLHGSQEYRNACLSKIAMQKYSTDDVSPDMLPKVKDPPHGVTFLVGMKLEAIDPLNLSAICVATVMKVLRNNYLMIGIDGSMAETGSDWFCYPSTSPCIFPVGFCEINNIDLTPPRGYKGMFKWFDYLKQTKSVAAPVKLFDKEIPKHGFRPGLKLEAVDLMEPRLICVATVTRIVGRLLRIHFDGWDNEYDQWVDCQSPDVYPVGWCQIMNYALEGPRIKESFAPAPLVQKKKKTKNQIYKGPRKKRKSKPPPGKPFPPGFRFLSMSSSSSGLQENSKSGRERASSIRPPHVPLPPETVAATLPPLLDQDFPLSKKVKPEPDKTSLIEKMSSVVNTGTSMTHASSSESVKSLILKGSNSLSTPGNAELRSPVKVELESEALQPQIFTSSSGIQSCAGTNDIGQVTNTNGNGLLRSAELDKLPASSFDEVADWSTVSSAASSSSFLDSSIISVDHLKTKALNFASTGRSAPILEGTSGHVTLTPSQDAVLSLTPELQRVAPELWSVQDVCLFLRINDCGTSVDAILKKNIDGKQLMELSSEQIISLAGTKVGPSLRITQLLQQLRTYSSGRKTVASSGTSHASVAQTPMEID